MSPIAQAMARFFEPRRSPALRAARGLGRATVRIAASPIARIELAAALRRKRFVATLTTVLLVVFAILIGVIAASAEERPSEIGRAIFAAYVVAMAIVVALLFPAFSCMSIVEERMRRSLDLLLTTRLEPWEILAGKIAGSFVYCAIFLVATLPVVALSFLFGGIELRSIVAAYALALEAALLISIVGTTASATAQSSIVAVLLAYLASAVALYLVGFCHAPIAVYGVGPSTLWLDADDLDDIERELGRISWYLHDGGAAIAWAAVAGFFATAGANRLKPPTYDRASPMRGFLAGFLLVAFIFYIACVRLAFEEMRRIDEHNGFGDWAMGRLREALFEASFGIQGGIAVVLFFAVLVFATESPALSRRVARALGALPRLSPARLLRPGAGRGMWFAIALTLGLIGAFTAHGYEVLLLKEAVPHARSRADVAFIETALVFAAFLCFLAAFGRFFAERARRPAWPRALVAATALGLLFAPLFAFVADQTAWRRMPAADREAYLEEERRVPLPIARGYFLSPIAAVLSAYELPQTPDRLVFGYLRPGSEAAKMLGREIARLERENGSSHHLIQAAERRGAPMYIAPVRRPRFSTQPVAAHDAASLPFQRVTIGFYAALAVAFGIGGIARRMARERRERAAAAGPAAVGAQAGTAGGGDPARDRSRRSEAEVGAR